jgi:hypothetical protein
MRQPAIKPPIGYKTYLQSIYKTFYRPARSTHILDPLSILPTMLVGTLLARNSSNMPRPWLFQ